MKSRKQTSTSKIILPNKKDHPYSWRNKKRNWIFIYDEYIEKKPKKTIQEKPNQKLTIAAKLKSHQKLLSSDDENSMTSKYVINTWAEVYIESEEKWVCVDVLGKKINCVSHMYISIIVNVCLFYKINV